MLKIQLIRTVKTYKELSIIKLGNTSGLGIRADKVFNERTKTYEYHVKGTSIADYDLNRYNLEKGQTVNLIFKEEDIDVINSLLSAEVNILINNTHYQLKLPNSRVLVGINRYRNNKTNIYVETKNNNVTLLSSLDEDYSRFLLEKRIESFHFKDY